MYVYAPYMEVLAAIGAVAVAWFVITCIRGWTRSGQRLDEIRRANTGRPSSWEGSAEQTQLHANDNINQWSSDRPY